MEPKPSVNRDDERGMIELGIEEGGHFVALASMPTTQFDSTIENLKNAESGEGSSE